MPENEQAIRPVMLMILDGFGWREERADNAVALAKKPNFDRLWQTYPHAFLRTCGKDVGLPEGQMGNSEVGHLNIGAGRVVVQELPRISAAVQDGSLSRNQALTDLISKTKASGGVCHLLGLVSPGGVHAHQDHAAALARILDQAGLKTCVHAFTDGRDTPPDSGREDLRRLASALPQSARIVTVSGRYFAMDRDKRWDRVEKAYRVIAEADGPRFEIQPMPVVGKPPTNTKPSMNSSSPRLWEITGGWQTATRCCASISARIGCVRSLARCSIRHSTASVAHARSALPPPREWRSTARAIDTFLMTLFPPEALTHVRGEVTADAGRTQLRAAETEKYAHVTYFLNGGQETQFRGEDRILVPSPKVATYDLQPEMSAPALDLIKWWPPSISGDTTLIEFELHEPGHGGPYRQPSGSDQGRGNSGCRPGPDRGRCNETGRRAAGDSGSWQLRADERPRNRWSIHGAHPGSRLSSFC